jgi:hypothetical protein
MVRRTSRFPKRCQAKQAYSSSFLHGFSQKKHNNNSHNRRDSPRHSPSPARLPLAAAFSAGRTSPQARQPPPPQPALVWGRLAARGRTYPTTVAASTMGAAAHLGPCSHSLQAVPRPPTTILLLHRDLRRISLCMLPMC